MGNLYLSLTTVEEATDTVQNLRTVLSAGGINFLQVEIKQRLKGLNSEL